MATRVISTILLLAFLNFVVNCTKTVKVFKDDFSGPTEKIVEVILPNGEVIQFGDEGGKYIPETRTIRGFNKVTGIYVEISVDDILYARVKKADPVKSIVATIGVLAIIAAVGIAIALATKESCPFIYSYDGQKYVFDAEPYGGAICQGLKKTDYSRLEHLRPTKGEYRLLICNEVNETQYTDQVKLLIVDHSKDTEIAPDLAGNLHVVKNSIGPSRAYDENGKDLSRFVYQRDDVAWQTHLPTDSLFPRGSLRHQLTFEFPRPSGASQARLVVNAGTALWGSEMIRKMLELRGNQVDRWYQKVNQGGPELKELIQFTEREELYLLKICVKKGTEWVQKGILPGGGPFITEDRILSLDLTDIPGDTVMIRLNPPLGFWAVDHIALQYDDFPSPPVREVNLAHAQDQLGKDISDILRSNDNVYQVLPKAGDWAKVVFEAPAQPKGTKRTIFLETSGYYELHLDKNQPEQTELIQKLLATPGAILEYSMNEYLKWRSAQLSSN